jgi:hypothetical protein
MNFFVNLNWMLKNLKCFALHNKISQSKEAARKLTNIIRSGKDTIFEFENKKYRIKR